MFRRMLVVSAVAAGIFPLNANASAPALADAARPAVHADGFMLAQSGDVEIYYDEFGRRVIVDAYTGEILSVERPRRLRERREELRRQRQDLRQERYYLDDPEDVARLRREKLRDQGILTAPPPIDDYQDSYGRPLPRGLDNSFPEAPGRAYPEEPEIIAREPIEREPLADPDQPSGR